MQRAVATGNIQLALLNVAVKLYKANKDGDVHFKNIHAVCHGPLVSKRWCNKCNREVLAEEINKGFQVSKGQMVEFSEKELEVIAIQESKQIKIERVVGTAELPLAALDSLYYLQPDKYAEHAYSLLAKALAVKGQVLIGRLIMRSKEHLVAIRAYEGGLMLSTLHWHDEIHSIKPLLEKLEAVPDEELQLATALIDRLKAPLGLESFRDTYREKVEDMIQKRVAGVAIEVPQVKAPEPQVSVMDALRQSMQIQQVATP